MYQSCSKHIDRKHVVHKWVDLLQERKKWSSEYERPASSNFDMDIQHIDIGPVAILSRSISPAVINRFAKSPSANQTLYFSLNLLTRGEYLLSHHGRKNLVKPGEVILADSAFPSTLTFAEPSHTISVIIPSTLLRLYLPYPESVCNLVLSPTQGFSGTLKEMLINLWNNGKEGLCSEIQERSIKALLEILTLSLISHPNFTETGSPTKNRVFRIKSYIETNLSDPELSPCTLSKAFHLSPRHLRKVFSSEGESIARYISRRRLEISAEKISNSLWNSRSITDIAFSSGFRSSAHFTRAFKTYFGVTPKEYRQQVGSRRPVDTMSISAQ